MEEVNVKLEIEYDSESIAAREDLYNLYHKNVKTKIEIGSVCVQEPSISENNLPLMGAHIKKNVTEKLTSKKEFKGINEQSEYGLSKPKIEISEDMCEKWEGHKLILPDQKPETDSCQLCNKTFKTKTALKSHETTHHKKTTYSCDMCKIIFSTESALTAHEAKNLCTERKFWKCKFCKRRCRSKVNLTTHKTVCSKRKLKKWKLGKVSDAPFWETYPCDICNKKFRVKLLLTYHKLSHKIKKPIVCKICSKVFKRPIGLSMHMNIKHAEIVLESPSEFNPQKSLTEQ